MKNFQSSLIGSIFGFLSRPCCSIPFFYSLFGLGSSGIAAALEPYRVLFLIIALISFSIGGYLTFRVRGAVFNKAFFVASVTLTFIFLYLPKIWFKGIEVMDSIISSLFGKGAL